MATKLFLRNTELNGLSDASNTVYDMVTTAGSVTDTAVVNTGVAGTAEIWWTKNAGDTKTITWVSGRTPAGGFTLTQTDISIWAAESNMSANCGGKFYLWKIPAGSGIVFTNQILGGTFVDGVEFGTTAAEMTWIANNTDTAFSEDDRVAITVYISAVGTMADTFTCTLTFNGADGATGDSFFNLAETVVFKPEPFIPDLNMAPYRWYR